MNRYKVENSCRAYHEMMRDTCSLCLPLTQDFEWGKDLKKSKVLLN